MSEDNYAVVSADCHCGADLYGYKPYLESRYHDDFDRWARDVQDPWADLDIANDDYRIGVSSFASSVNWDSEKRTSYLDGQGISAEVLFPNTIPPFFPSGMIGAHAPATRDEFEYRSAGIRAHNRWLADFCNESPGRRAGIAQVFLNDVDEALTEIRWAHGNGLRGVLLPPDHMLQLSNLYYPRYEPIWQLCEELSMPLHRHGVVPSEAVSDATGVAGPAIGLAEVSFYNYRPLRHLILAGVFDRHPGLSLVITECQAAGVLNVVAELDFFVKYARIPSSLGSLFAGEAVERLQRMPSEYLHTNIFHGSFFDANDIEKRALIGIDRMMWGADFPHHEGTSPFTLLALRHNFAGVPHDEVRRMVSTNAIRLYGLDAHRLQRIADRIGPSPEAVDSVVQALPSDVGRMCPTFGDSFDLIGKDVAEG